MKPKMHITLVLIATLIFGQIAQTFAGQRSAQRETPARGRGKGRIVNSYRVKRQASDEEQLSREQGRPDWVNNAVRRSAARLETQKRDFGLREVNDDLRLVSAEQDDFGKTHLRLRQLHNGVEVFGSQLISHVEGETVTSIGGRSFNVSALDTTPALSAEQAIEAAKKALAYQGEFAKAPSAKLTVLPHSVFTDTPGADATLTWQVTLQIEDGTDATAMHQYFVDTRDGRIVWHYDSMPKSGVGYSLYNGTVPVQSLYVPPGFLSAAQYKMIDITHSNNSVYDMNGGINSPTTIFVDPDNVWGDGTFSNRQSAAVDAQYGVSKAWDYFASVFGRRGWDNNGMEVDCRVHYGSNFNNAFESQGTNYLSFGDGDGSQFTSLVSLDVVAHEFTHGVTEHTSGLIYANEAGALNESFSDIFGTAVEFAYKSNANYLIGEQCYTPNTPNDALRDMTNPGIDNYANRLYQGTCSPTKSNDNCGVHFNSGIMNNAFYLLAAGGANRTSLITVPSIGRRNAEMIFYRALTLYLFPSAKFYDARVATVNAAVDLFGPDSAEHRAVETAWEAVGVSAPHLLFYNASDGSGALVQVTQNGALSQKSGYGPGSFATSWTDIVPARNDLFFFNRDNGLYAVARVDQNGSVYTLSSGTFPANPLTMARVVSTDNNVFLYSGVTLGGTIYRIDENGLLGQTESFNPNSFGVWTSIVDTAFGMFFYNKSSGVIAVGNVNQAGQFVQTDGGENVGTGFDQVVVQGGHILLYNSSTGAYALGSIGSDGKLSTTTITSCGSPLQPGYKNVVAMGSTLFFYNPDNAAAAVGSILPLSQIVTGQCRGQLSITKFYSPYQFAIGWTNLVSTGNGLVFYNSGDGSAAVGYFAADGSFIQTSGYSLSPYWSKVVTTEK
jgi:Zn-dependent metalloprotease